MTLPGGGMSPSGRQLTDSRSISLVPDTVNEPDPRIIANPEFYAR